MIRERSVRSRFSSRVLLIHNVGTYTYLKINRPPPPIDSRVAANAAESSRVRSASTATAVRRILLLLTLYDRRRLLGNNDCCVISVKSIRTASCNALYLRTSKIPRTIYILYPDSIRAAKVNRHTVFIYVCT